MKHKFAALLVAVSMLFVAVPSFAATALTRFLVSIDVETGAGCGAKICSPDSLEKKVWGHIDGNVYGIQLMMDILDNYNTKGTFFVNAYLDSYFPEDEVREIVEYIVERGHDVQFHSHEEFRCFAICETPSIECWKQCTKKTSYLAGNTLDQQIQILEEGARNIEKWSGKYPVAFRGGGFEADGITLKALKHLNINIDSSMSRPDHALGAYFPPNQVSEYEGVVEVPVYNFVQNLFIRKYMKHLDLESNTFQEQKFLVDEAIRHDTSVVVLMMHSFSFCRPGFGCPNNENIERFKKLLEYVESSSGIEPITFWDFSQEYKLDKQRFAGPSYIPETGYWQTLHRSYVRFDQGLNNKVFLLGNVGAVFFAFVLLIFLWKKMRSR